MNKGRPVSKRRCKAMVEENILDPVSKEGIDFCTGSCPYPYYCVALEHKPHKLSEKTAVARKFKNHGVSVEDIALILDVPVRSIMRYLKL